VALIVSFVSSIAAAQAVQPTIDSSVSIKAKAGRIISHTERAVVGDNGRRLPPPDGARVKPSPSTKDVCHNLEPDERKANPLCGE
jgi:hypothetical protein